MRRRRQRIRPMPTEEDKRKAQLKAASADPLVWAMKKVDEAFPDSREKSADIIEAEAVADMVDEGDDIEIEDEVIDDSRQISDEIKAEGKLAVPTNDGVLTMEVTPQRQNVDNVSEDKIERDDAAETNTKIENETEHKAEKNNRKMVNVIRKSAKSSNETDSKTQIQLTALEAKQKRMVLGFIGLVALALGAVVFAVVAMVNQKSATETLETQIAASTTVGENSVDDNYIYLKDWKMKIKLISGLEHVSFDYDEDEYSSVLIWGARKNPGVDYTPDFAKQSKNTSPLGIITRVPRYERAAAGRLIWYDDYYNYYYQGPAGEPEADEAEMSWWVESYLLIKDMLTNADNYIKFEDSAIGRQ